jgi:hypothetical protein
VRGALAAIVFDAALGDPLNSLVTLFGGGLLFGGAGAATESTERAHWRSIRLTASGSGRVVLTLLAAQQARTSPLTEL